MYFPHPRPFWVGLGVYIGRGLRLFFYRLRDCEALIEREELTNFTLFLYMAIHIGNKIETVLRQQGRNITWFAEQICCERTNVYSIFHRSSIDTELLLRISVVLNYDFFEEYQELLKQHTAK